MTEANEREWIKTLLEAHKLDVERMLLDTETRIVRAMCNFQERVPILRREPIHGYEELTKRTV